MLFFRLLKHEWRKNNNNIVQSLWILWETCWAVCGDYVANGFVHIDSREKLLQLKLKKYGKRKSRKT